MNATTDAVKKSWQRNGWGARIAALAGVVAIVATLTTGIVWFIKENAWTGDILRHAMAEETARTQLAKDAYQQDIQTKLDLNDVRRKAVDSELLAIEIRQKNGITWDSDAWLKQSLQSEREDLLDRRQDLRQMQTRGARNANE